MSPLVLVDVKQAKVFGEIYTNHSMTLEEVIDFLEFVPNPNTNPGEPDYIRERDGAELWYEDTDFFPYDGMDDDLKDRLKKMSLEEFIERASVENDDTHIYTTGIIGVEESHPSRSRIHPIQASIPIDLVMGESEESYPFEASTILDKDHGHPAWEDMYKSYLEEIGED